MKTKWALNELKRYQDQPLKLDGTVDFSESLKNRDNEILYAEPIQIRGTLENEKNEVYYVDLVLDTVLTMPSSRSLEPVKVQLTIPFSEIYLPALSSVSLESFTEDELVEELSEDILDLQKPIEDTILTNKPTQVFTEDERQSGMMPSGKGWHVIDEEDHNDHPGLADDGEGDPRFAALKDLFKEDNE